jgi:hypothetical protein
MSDKVFASSEKGIELKVLSRRQAFSFLGLTAALSIVGPGAVLTAPDANAQTPGMERREDRREERQDRREDRRDDRVERREDRRTGGTDQPTTTGTSSTGTPSTSTDSK